MVGFRDLVLRGDDARSEQARGIAGVFLAIDAGFKIRALSVLEMKRPNTSLQPTATGPVSFKGWERVCRSVTPAAYAPVAPSLASVAGGAIIRWLWLSFFR